jgi:branched-chain amino acid transport system substrate-binding protein
MPLTGAFGEFGNEQLRGLKMWRDDLNARGALLGRPVELVYYDDGSSSSTSAELYEKLITQDKVDLLIGPYGSRATLKATVVTDQHNFPIVTTAASADQIWGRGMKNVFGIDTPSSDYMDPAIAAAKEAGARTIALVFADAEFSRDVARGVREQVKAQGLQLVLDQSYARKESNFSAVASQLAKADADVVLGATYLLASMALVKAMDAPGVKPKMVALTVGPAVREFGDNLGTQAEGIVGVVQWLRDVRQPKAQDFAYRYRSKYQNNPGVHGAIGYSAGQRRVRKITCCSGRTTAADWWLPLTWPAANCVIP